MREIHARAGFMRLNSRISDLRNRGHEITCTRKKGDYVYRLISPAEPQPQAAPTAPCGSADESGQLALHVPRGAYEEQAA
jgi:hypothetical protein